MSTHAITSLEFLAQLADGAIEDSILPLVHLSLFPFMVCLHSLGEGPLESPDPTVSLASEVL